MHRTTHKNEYYNIFINYIPSIVSYLSKLKQNRLRNDIQLTMEKNS